MAIDTQTPFDVAVVIQTTARPTLLQAVRSVYEQDLTGRIQIMVGLDHPHEDESVVSALEASRPERVSLKILELGYSTSQRHGSLYSNSYGGALRTILSYAANSRYVAYLDDDNWWAPTHLSSLLSAIHGKAWAFSLRYLVDRVSDEVICRDEWESVGPGKGVYLPGFGGWADTSCLMLDKMQCHEVLPAWCTSRFDHGVGEDRMVFERLKGMASAATNQYTTYYRTRLDGFHPYVLWKIKQAGVDLHRFMSPDRVPSHSVWMECAQWDRDEATRQRRQEVALTAGQPGNT